ncbi:hypothetical protein PQG02_15460 [Nostoc sp. UHCC 0926]|uniref:hypothetical protein n=1 Tax=unclassified Nostoc TaxID=2593658 RepID=UPI00236129B4|nr:hypothetical protein [Nostoc sp. UHCC 0926]WDD35627.1 hypothetical protein PQG02_15460 [Nostoc sp. UHCC 0926]
MINFSFQTDEDTVCLFQIVIWCLKKYFCHTDNSAVEAINSYYEKNLKIHDDDFYHHETVFRVAVRIHYFEVLKGEANKFHDWIRESDYNYSPREAIDYFNTFYFYKKMPS